MTSENFVQFTRVFFQGIIFTSSLSQKKSKKKSIFLLLGLYAGYILCWFSIKASKKHRVHKNAQQRLLKISHFTGVLINSRMKEAFFHFVWLEIMSAWNHVDTLHSIAEGKLNYNNSILSQYLMGYLLSWYSWNDSTICNTTNLVLSRCRLYFANCRIAGCHAEYWF